MKRNWMLLAVAVWSLSALAADAAKGFDVVWDKPKDRGLAFEMGEILRDLTNALCRKTGILPRVGAVPPADARTVVYLGSAAERASGADLSSFRRGDWRVKTEPGKVYLLGRTPFAVSSALTEFCERYLDYYFLTLEGDDPCTVDPDVKIPTADVTVRPAIYVRSIYHGMFNGIRYPKTKKHWTRWSRLRRIRVPNDIEGRFRVSSAPPRTCHSQLYFVPPDLYFKEHPEYYSMGADGKRTAKMNFGSQLCFTSEGALEVCYQSLMRFIAKDRAQFPTNYPCIYDFTQQDCSGQLCLCPKCREVIAKYNRKPGGNAEGGDAGLQLEFVNRLARRVRATYPDVMLRIFAYVSTGCPPREGTIRPEPNVIVWWCDVYSRSDHTMPLDTPGSFNAEHAEEVDGWLKLTRNLQVWDYMLYGRDFPEVAADAIAGDARFFGARGLPQMSMQSEYAGQPFYLLNGFLMSELYVDPSRSVDDLIRIYCRVYGPAAAKMEAAIGLLRRMECERRATTKAEWHNRLLPWITRANFERLAAALQDAYDTPGLRPSERARIADVLAVTWKRLMTLLKADRTAGEACRRAQEQWVKFEKVYSEGAVMEDRDRAAYVRKVEEERELLSLRFKDLPPELKDVPAEELVFVDYHRGYPVTTDAASERGSAVEVHKKDPSFDPTQPVSCDVWDFLLRKGRRFTVEKMPDSDTYVWRKLGPVYIGRSSKFRFPVSRWSWFALDSFHLLSDGVAVDPNHYDLWISIRFVKGSPRVDRLAFRRIPPPVK